jgi:hypothetical protein
VSKSHQVQVNLAPNKHQSSIMVAASVRQGRVDSLLTQLLNLVSNVHYFASTTLSRKW